MKTDYPIDIIVTTFQREWATKLCLDAIERNTITPYRLIVIDNGSSPDARFYYMDVADTYVKLDTNRGLEYAKWLGMQFVESNLFVSTDNDILPYEYEGDDWLMKLVNLMNKYPDYGAIALRPQILVGTGNIFHNRENEDIIPFGHVPGYGRIMRTDWVNEVGAWNDKRPLRGHEEYWIGEKFAEKGYKMAFSNHIECWHLFGDEETDPWGYPKEMTPEAHGHNPISSLPANDKGIIKERVGIVI